MAGRDGGAEPRHDGGAGARAGYRSVFVQHPDRACELGLRGRTVPTNPVLQRLTGYGDDELRHLDLLAARVIEAHFLPKPYTAQSLLSTLPGALRAEA